MHVMHKSFCGDKEVSPRTPIAWHTKMAVYLMNAAKGDLMLDHHGNLTLRNIWGEDHRELPFNQHTPRGLMALIGSEGWIITMEGA